MLLCFVIDSKLTLLTVFRYFFSFKWFVFPEAEAKEADKISGQLQSTSISDGIIPVCSFKIFGMCFLLRVIRIMVRHKNIIIMHAYVLLNHMCSCRLFLLWLFHALCICCFNWVEARKLINALDCAFEKSILELLLLSGTEFRYLTAASHCISWCQWTFYACLIFNTLPL